MFARRLGLAVGRLDWWKIRGEHTPYEWALQKVADAIDPLGAERDDMRSGAAVAQIVRAVINAMAGEVVDFAEAGEYARHYLERNQPADEVLSPEEAAELKRGR